MATGRAGRRARRELRQFGIDPAQFALVGRRLWKRVGAGEITIDQLQIERAAALGLDERSAKEVMNAYTRIGDAVRVRLGARRLIRDLRAAGKRVVILTNFQGQVDRQHRKIRSVGLHEQVDGIVVTGDIGVHKPDAGAFEAALATVGGSAARAAMLGDNLVNDICGSLDAGFARAVWVTERRRRPEHPRLVVVRNLSQAREALLA